MLPRFPILLSFAALLAPAASAISTQHTAPVGFMRYQVSAGLETVGFPLVQAPVFSGAVNSVTADGLRTAVGSGATALRARLEAGRTYYVEFTAGPAGDTTFVGDRIEVDVTATMDADNPRNHVRLQPGHERSTLRLVPEDLAGYRFVLRAHVTLASVLGTRGNSPLQAGTTPANGDQVHVLEHGSFQTYLYQNDARSGLPRWVKYPEGTTADNLPVAPGTGMFLRRVGPGSVSFEHLGAVRTNAFVQPLECGYTLISEPYPVASSFATRGMTAVNGFVAGPNTEAADTVYVWTGSTYRTLFYAAVAGASADWRPADATPQSLTNEAETAFSPYRAVLVQKRVADPAYIVPNPF